MDKDVPAVGDGLPDESDGDLDVAEDVLVVEVGDVEVQVGDAREEGAHLGDDTHITSVMGGGEGYPKSKKGRVVA